MKIKGLPVFSAGKVAVVGDLMLDRYMHGDTSRISPEAPVPVVRVEETEDRAGGAGNVALNLAALGGGVELFGLTGEDDTAVLLEKILTDAHINCHFQPLKDVPTITKLRVLSRHQQLLRLDFESPFSEESASLLPPLLQSHLANVGALILSDYAKGSLHASQQLIEMANNAGIPIIVDPSHSSGKREMIKSLSWAAMAAGADGIMIETHFSPDTTICDSKQTIDFQILEEIMKPMGKLMSLWKN